jgi:hypothetical protein
VTTEPLPPPDEAWALEAIQACLRLGLIGRPAGPAGSGLAPTHLGLLVGAVLEQLCDDLLDQLVARCYLLDRATEPELDGRAAVLCARYYDDPRRGGTELLAPTPKDTP